MSLPCLISSISGHKLRIEELFNLKEKKMLAFCNCVMLIIRLRLFSLASNHAMIRFSNSPFHLLWLWHDCVCFLSLSYWLKHETIISQYNFCQLCHHVLLFSYYSDVTSHVFDVIILSPAIFNGLYSITCFWIFLKLDSVACHLYCWVF